MKYASEHAGVLTSVHQWKPVTPDRFAALLHHYATALCDLHGHDAISHTSIALAHDATATIYYRRQDREHPVSYPALMTMEGPAGKVLCFETTNPDCALEPKPPVQVIREAAAHREGHLAKRLKAAAEAVIRSPEWVVVVAPREADFEVIRSAVGRAGGSGENVRYVTATGLSGIRRDGKVSAIWLHNAGMIGGAALNTVMHEIADIMAGRGWMAMTGHTPLGWASPEGLPKERI